MISLRVAIIFALSTQFVSYGSCGYVVVSVDNSLPESETPESKAEPLPETLYTPVIETTTVPTLDEPQEVEDTSAVQEISTPSDRLPRKATGSSLWKDCTNGKGCFIKHFRQYNYYYPNGQRVVVPIQNNRPITTEDLLPNPSIPDELLPVTSSVRMTNDNGRVTVQTSSKPTVSYNLPGVTSYVPNNGFNYIYNQFDSGLRQNTQAYAGASSYDQRPVSEEEQVVSEEASAEQTAEPAQEDDSSSGNVNKDITTYLSGPNVFGQSRLRVVKNGNNGNFQSSQVSVSSSVQSRPFQVAQAQEEVSTLSDSYQDEDESSTTGSSGNVDKDITTYFSGPNMYGQKRQRIIQNGNNQNFQSQQVSVSTRVQSKPLQQVAEEQEEVTSSTSSEKQSESSSKSEPPSINSAKYGFQNRFVYGYDPYFQTYHQFGVPPIAPLPYAGFPSPIYSPAGFPYYNPVSTWPNYPAPAPSPLYDIPGMAPAYSVIL
ncbi:uncharacterized protein LOC129915703 [Episyrphus balteatus]|uniref:uncharacterized protein LOC129915703 n=1 Tax=Episyrphus balteatus TaxID=286459 RepID=UPI002485CE8B|nr:uncharacterized protein LOC129915703 [Episyrphus balteatus]